MWCSEIAETCRGVCVSFWGQIKNDNELWCSKFISRFGPRTGHGSLINMQNTFQYWLCHVSGIMGTSCPRHPWENYVNTRSPSSILVQSKLTIQYILHHLNTGLPGEETEWNYFMTSAIFEKDNNDTALMTIRIPPSWIGSWSLIVDHDSIRG